jgi:hypothetical protein
MEPSSAPAQSDGTCRLSLGGPLGSTPGRRASCSLVSGRLYRDHLLVSAGGAGDNNTDTTDNNNTNNNDNTPATTARRRPATGRIAIINHNIHTQTLFGALEPSGQVY